MSSNSILSWDDEEIQPVNTVAAQRAVEALANLDTTEAEAELVGIGKQIQHTQAAKAAGAYPPGGSSAPLFTGSKGHTAQTLLDGSNRALKAAMSIVERMDAELESGGRVAVDQKALLNCKADLNQLVPFKYNWAWSIYLTSAANNWMPAELNLDRSATAVKQLNDAHISKLIGRFYISMKYREHTLREQTLLSCYRIITNPECRQYILRQSFESAMIHQAMDTIDEFFAPKTTYLDGVCGTKVMLDKDRDVMNSRVLATKSFTFINDPMFDTVGIENTGKFLSALACLYGYFNFMVHIVPILQLKKGLENVGTGHELVELCRRIMIDVMAQTTFIKNFISGALVENEGVNISSEVNKQFRHFINIESDLFENLRNDHDEFAVIDCVLKYFANDFLEGCGITSEIRVPTPNPEAQVFIGWLKDMCPGVDHDAGLSGVSTAGAGGALSW